MNDREREAASRHPAYANDGSNACKSQRGLPQARPSSVSFKVFLASFLVLVLVVCASAVRFASLNQGARPHTPLPATPAEPVLHTAEVAVGTDGGTFFVMAAVNGFEMPFMIDSGSSVICLPDAFIGDLRRRSLLTDADIRGWQNSELADGRIVRSKAYNLTQFTIGTWVLVDVAASSCGKSKVALLGQAVLGRFVSWSLDNQRNVLMLTAWKKE